jgi:hypothetical protein
MIEKADMREVYKRLHVKREGKLRKAVWDKITWPFYDWLKPEKHTEEQIRKKHIELTINFIDWVSNDSA